ncbi:MAG: CBS domain-containing protein, partial [Chloroflexi bacterium]
HHRPHRSPPANAVVSLTETGATATLLVEQIRDRHLSLTPLEATLLLLGIYEDTGSLTYVGTTPRDLQAAAWLLAEGHARLDIARDYLNYPMSDIQRELYRQLVDRLETHTIYGHTVIIGQASVPHYVEEISTLAHRMRDLYRPDALFVLVEMVDHVQMVARSTTDAIDVGRIARFMGGGGHARAAAALLKDRSLSDCHAELLRLLKLQVRPAVMVQEIMSRGARTLSPADTVRRAAEMMNRYGHEGFPVVEPESGRIVGVISRREIDKALRHKLDGAAIAQFMTAGEFYVTPTDSVDAVQTLMVEHQIGQVPVVDRPGGKVIGIVTRTDLINLWHKTRHPTDRQLNLADQLRRTLSAPLFRLLQQAGQLAASQGDTLYLVGGFVRDLLLMLEYENDPAAREKTSPRFDLDLVVEGDAIALARQLQARNRGRVVSHQRFGTAKWILENPIPFHANNSGVTLASLDFVTARTEFYEHPSALPEVERSSIRQDLHRRDFTINTLALNLNPDRLGELLDFYGGQNDLRARLIRVLHSLSFVEDPTRMLRAARLIARLDFKLEERTAELLENARDLLERVSGERIFNELVLIFRERSPEKALRVLDQLGILAVIHPGLMMDDWLEARLRQLRGGLADTPWAGISPQPIHYLALMAFFLARDELDTLMQRLNLRADQRKLLRQVYTIRRRDREIAAAEKNSTLYHLLAPTSDEARMVAWIGLDNEAARGKLVHFQTTLRNVEPIINGDYLKEEMGLTPGPLFRTILTRLRDARLDGEVLTLSDERRLVEQILA